MRYLLLFLALTGCTAPPRRVSPADLGPNGAVHVTNKLKPIPPYGSVEAPGDETKYLLDDGLHKVQVRDGKIIASEPVPGGLPALEAELFEAASAKAAQPRP